jgi:hypothetical protein
MQALRDLWASSNTTIRIVVICAVLVLALSGMAYGLGIDWLTDLLGD